MSLSIDEVMDAIEKNIRSIILNKKFDIEDAKMNLVDIWGIIKDFWERFQDVFNKINKIKDIEEATEKGEKYKEKIQNPDTKRYYV